MGTQTAWVLLPSIHSRGIIEKGWLKISVVSCRVRQAERKSVRCFRCQAYGHDTKACQGKDHSANCMRCWKTRHMVKDCKEEADEATASGLFWRRSRRKPSRNPLRSNDKVLTDKRRSMQGSAGTCCGNHKQSRSGYPNH